jgi:hypothetical protein
MYLYTRLSLVLSSPAAIVARPSIRRNRPLSAAITVFTHYTLTGEKECTAKKTGVWEAGEAMHHTTTTNHNHTTAIL